MVDCPLHAESNRLKKIVQLPAAASERANVANGIHWDFNQTARIDKRLSRLLRAGYAVVDALPWRRTRLAHGMRRVFAAYPAKPKIEQHLLNIGPLRESIEKSARRAKSGRFNADS